MSQNRELVLFYIKHKLSQKNFPLTLATPPNRPEVGGATRGHAAPPPPPPASPLRRRSSSAEARSMQAVKEALRDSAREFELRFTRAFGDLSRLNITPATARQIFETVMEQVFRDGINWGRVTALFAFGGALCVECAEKEMSSLVWRIAEWMSVYLDVHVQPWIQAQGGWEFFAEKFGKDAAAESRRSQERFRKRFLAGMALMTWVVVGSLFAQKCL